MNQQSEGRNQEGGEEDLNEENKEEMAAQETRTAWEVRDVDHLDINSKEKAEVNRTNSETQG